MVEHYTGYMDKRVEDFFEKTLGEKYTACHTFIVPQKEINKISPPKKYPNPEFNNSNYNVDKIIEHLSKIIRLIELSKKCRFNKNQNPKECPFFETKRLEELSNKVLNSKEPNINIISRINIKLKTISKKFNAKRVHCFHFEDEFCSCDCKGLIYDFKINNVGQLQYQFEFDSNEFDKYIDHKTIGLYLNREHRTNQGDVYPKGSVLISKYICHDNGTFEQTFIHEHTHAILHAILKGFISKNKGLNEGFAVAMEYFYAKDNCLNFNKTRYGEYLAHQILTILDNPNEPKELLEKIKNKKRY